VRKLWQRELGMGDCLDVRDRLGICEDGNGFGGSGSVDI
jgi:hypothetical protein